MASVLIIFFDIKAEANSQKKLMQPNEKNRSSHDA